MMKSPAFKTLVFPELPQFSYQTAPLYLEPMLGSGERLAIVGVVVGENEFLVEKLVTQETAQALYGKQGKNLIGFADLIIADLNNYLLNADIKDWQPCFDGVEIGKLQATFADHAKHALAQIAQLHASLCRLPALIALEDDDAEEEKKDTTLAAWVKQVQAQLIAGKPHLAHCFNVRETLSQGDTVQLHYAYQQTAANIGLISPSSLKSRVDDAKIKLWNLDHLPGHYQDKRLILGIPHTDDPVMADNRVKEKVLSKIDALADEAKKSGIRTMTAYNAKEAAENLAA